MERAYQDDYQTERVKTAMAIVSGGKSHVA
jgi:hypothetical protein